MTSAVSLIQKLKLAGKPNKTLTGVILKSATEKKQHFRQLTGLVEHKLTLTKLSWEMHRHQGIDKKKTDILRKNFADCQQH